MINAYWYLSQNFGDALTPWLINRLSGQPAVWTDLDSKVPKYMVTGSILNDARENCIVWGCGLGTFEQCICPKTDIRMVRGPMSLQRCLDEHHVEVDAGIHGDPGLLLPSIYNPTTKCDKYQLGIIPHYVDQENAWNIWLSDFNSDQIKFINVCDPVEKVVDDIWSCECIASSSLHGLVVGDAFRKRTAWIVLSDKICGDGMKYLDHWGSIRTSPEKATDYTKDVTDQVLKEVLMEKCRDREAHIDVDGMLGLCPFPVVIKPEPF